MNVTKPLIKWVGGKTQILDKLYTKFIQILDNKLLDNYYEIFLGGGSVLLALLSWIESGELKVSKDFTIRAYDINKTLVHIFINVRDKPQELYNTILPMIQYYNSVDEDKREKYYYSLREYYNSVNEENYKDVGVSALFIFLNKTGFRGLYREGPSGYNVPFGHYKNPEILNYEHLMQVSRLIQNVIFEVASFETSLNIEHNDSISLVYLDPPYAPENSKSFTKYTKNDFTLSSHETLFRMCNNLQVPFIMSNSYVEMVKEHFENKEKYLIEIIECKRTINSKDPASKTKEVIILSK